MKLAIIAAVARNRAIGKGGTLPWHISEDLKRFKRLTMGHAILMGRKTFASIGRALPGRRNVVLSSRPLADVETYPTLDAALSALAYQERVFVIGGGQLYTQLLERADEIYLTLVHTDAEADTFFPPYENVLHNQFALVNRESHDGFTFLDYHRTTFPNGTQEMQQQ
ncbi:MAG: dihydrofolate reductase [Bacteroidota bacterium]